MSNPKADHRICRHCGREIMMSKGTWIAWEMPRSRFCGLRTDSAQKHEPR